MNIIYEVWSWSLLKRCIDKRCPFSVSFIIPTTHHQKIRRVKNLSSAPAVVDSVSSRRWIYCLPFTVLVIAFVTTCRAGNVTFFLTTSSFSHLNQLLKSPHHSVLKHKTRQNQMHETYAPISSFVCLHCMVDFLVVGLIASKIE